MKKNLMKVWIALFIVSMFIILFVNQVKDKTTWKTKLVLTTNGISWFKKWLDIAWWVRLSYKIDMSKYKETYKSGVEYANMRKRIQDIILTNIDTRISKLWVSDYQAYIQTLNNEDFAIVEIWWLTDIDEAKQLIWKTVELEFKIPNEQATGQNTDLPERLTMAKELLKSVQQNPAIFNSLGTWKASEDVYYNNLSWLELSQLPAIYQKNIEMVEQAWSGNVVASLLTWIYLSQANSQWEMVSLKWWTITKFNKKTRLVSDSVESSKLSQTAKTYWLESKLSYSNSKLDFPVKNYKYDAWTSTLIYNAWELFSGQDAYEIALYQIEKPNLVWKEATEADKLKSEVQSKSLEVKDNLINAKTPTYTWATLVYSGWLDKTSISSYLSSFTWDNGQKVLYFDETDWYFVMSVKNSKKAQDTLTKVFKVEWLTSDRSESFINDLKVKYVYDIEDIFVKDSPSWILAKDPKTSEILNWAYFKYASVEQSQLWKPVVSITFDDKWKEIFCNLTQVHVGKQMAIFVWWNLVTSPVIREEICGGTAQIDWSFDNAWAKEMTSDLNEWALPAKLILSHEEKISPMLWDTAMRWAIIAWAVALVIIFIFMIYMYGFKMWVISFLSLILFLSILFSIIKIIWYALSLSGIAAIILSIWMWVDANILIFERITEERKSWKSDYLSIKEWYERSMVAIKDWNLTTWMIWLLLFIVWTNLFKWFWTMMIINIALTLLVITKFSRDMLLSFTDETK